MFCLLIFIRCLCVLCSIMDRVSMCTCCSEHDKVIAKKVEQNISCITHCLVFNAAILNCLTLEIAYHQSKQEARERGWELQEKLSKNNRHVEVYGDIFFNLWL